eukprot:6071007-Pleurochrysis_carterae.AAC.2
MDVASRVAVAWTRRCAAVCIDIQDDLVTFLLRRQVGVPKCCTACQHNDDGSLELCHFGPGVGSLNCLNGCGSGRQHFMLFV